MTTTLTRTAPDISCDHCAHAITGALTALTGVGHGSMSTSIPNGSMSRSTTV